jgi:hypothetical protein
MARTTPASKKLLREKLAQTRTGPEQRAQVTKYPSQTTCPTAQMLVFSRGHFRRQNFEPDTECQLALPLVKRSKKRRFQ